MVGVSFGFVLGLGCWGLTSLGVLFGFACWR